MPDSTAYTRFQNFVLRSQTPEDKERMRLYFNNMMKSIENRKAYVQYIFNKISPHYLQKVDGQSSKLVINQSKYREIAYQVIESCVIEYDRGKFGLIHPTTGELHAESDSMFTTAIDFSYYIYEEFVATDFNGYVADQMFKYGKKLENDAKVLHRQNGRLTRLKKEAPIQKYRNTKAASEVAKNSGRYLGKFFRFMGSIPVAVWTNIFSLGGHYPPKDDDFTVSIYNLIADLCDGKLSDKSKTYNLNK